MKTIRTCLLASLLAPTLLLAQDRTFTPESGLYIVEGLSANAVNIALQDDFLGFVAYSYDPETGAPLFYTSQGFLTDHDFFAGDLFLTANGSCFGCPPTTPDPAIDVGDITIEWTDSLNATITISEAVRGLNPKGASVQLAMERFFFGWQGYRPGSPVPADRMLGEFFTIFPFSNFNLTMPSEMLVLDTALEDQDGPYVEGCITVDLTAGDCENATATVVAEQDPDTDEFLFVGPWTADESQIGFYRLPTLGNQQPASGIFEVVEAATGTVLASWPTRVARSASAAFIVTGMGPSSVDLKSATTDRATRMPLIEQAQKPTLTATEKAQRVAALARYQRRVNAER